MKLVIEASKKETFQKCCLELGFTCQFHELEPEELTPLMVNVYVKDNQLGDLTNKLAFYLGMAFSGELHAEIYKPIEPTTKLEFKDGGVYQFGVGRIPEN